jgi:hypothetical protein
MSVKGRPDRLIAKKEPGVFQVKESAALLTTEATTRFAFLK